LDYLGELLEAKQTLDLSVRTAAQFVAQLGAIAPILLPPLPAAHLGRRPGFQATVLDQKYWFAKLYELVTIEELNYSTHTRYPGFSLHFMKVFYGMYYGALQNYLKNAYAMVNPLWVTHFSGPPGADSSTSNPASMEAVKFSVRTGATAHIQGDMPLALVEAYRTWKADPKPAFEDLREDFIIKSENAFTRAQARFYIDVNDKTFSPLRPEVGQLAAAYYQAVLDIQPSLPVMFQWRRTAWTKASATVASRTTHAGKGT
jgi:hypothetical protein